MRRKDREVTEYTKIIEIIDQCHICRLGFFDGEEVYIVPLNFGYESKNESITLYFHSAQEGRKIDLIKQGLAVGFEMDTNYQLHAGPLACDYTAAFDSVIGNGTISLVEEWDEKRKGLELVMWQNTRKADWVYSEAMVKAVCIFKVEVTKLSAKRHL